MNWQQQQNPQYGYQQQQKQQQGYNNPQYGNQPSQYQQQPSMNPQYNQPNYGTNPQYGGYNNPPQQQQYMNPQSNLQQQQGYGYQQPSYNPSYNPSFGYQPPMVPTNHPLAPFFNAVDLDKSGKITWQELQKSLSLPGSEFTGKMFSERCARRLIQMFDKNGNAEIDFEEFTQLHNYLLQMKQGFEFVDKDRSGSLDFNEISMALQQSGYRISPNSLQKMFSVFDIQKKGSLNFDGYIELCVFIGIVRSAFTPRDTQRNGWATFSFDQFLEACSQFYI
ncbi:hypothetical protein ABK040_007490 [Willaertia magna]